MFSIHPIEVMWAQAPEEIKLELALNLVVDVLKISDNNSVKITFDDSKYEIVLNKLK